MQGFGHDMIYIGRTTNQFKQQMKKHHILMAAAVMTSAAMVMSSCTDSNDSPDMLIPTALVTVCPDSDGSFIMQLDNTTQLIPTNMTASPFDKKEVRALVNYTETAASEANDQIRHVHVNWIDSIRTKLPLALPDIEADNDLGNDPIEIINDWVTIAEDGYLTLRIRTRWGIPGAIHAVNLITGNNPDDPYELELRHNAYGDINGQWGDALIAFNLNGLPRPADDKTTLKLKWTSFSGEKNAEFDLQLRKLPAIDPEGISHSRAIR